MIHTDAMKQVYGPDYPHRRDFDEGHKDSIDSHIQDADIPTEGYKEESEE